MAYVADLSYQSLNTFVDKIPKISPQEELSYIHRAKEGDSIALERLMKYHFGAIANVAKLYTTRSHLLSEVIPSAVIGFMEGVSRYEADRDVSFITYAHWWMHNECRKEVTMRHPFKVPRNMHWTTRRIRGFIEQYHDVQNKDYPSLDEICRGFKITPETAEAIQQTNYLEELPSLDQPFMLRNGSDADQRRIVDITPDASSDLQLQELISSPLAVAAVEHAMNVIPLDAREALIMRATLGFPPYTRHHTRTEIVTMISPRVKRQRIQQILAQATVKLTRYFEECPFDTELAFPNFHG